MEIVKDKVLKIRVRDPDRITKVIPKSRLLKSYPNGVHEVAVHWGLEEAQVLKNLRIKGVPSPIKRHYNWPGIYKPFAHQVTTAEFLTLHKRAFCFNEVGTGKTLSVAWAMDYLMTLGYIKRALIVSPVSIMHAAWVSDLFKSAMHRSVGVAHGTKATRSKVINGDFEIVVINYDGVPIMFEELYGKFDLIVCDEASALKNVSTRRWKAVNKLLQPSTWLWLLTGTPAAQSPLDAYGLARLVSPQRVPQYFGGWRDKVMQKVTTFKWKPAPRATQIVNDALQPAIRFTKQQCLDLPEELYQTRDVELTPQQAKYYKEMKRSMLMTAAGEQVTAVHAAALLNKLLQLSCGAVYADTGDVIQFDASTRLQVLLDVVSETSNKVIVFVPFTHAIDLVHESLTKAGYTAEVINGAVPLKRRTGIFKRFQEEADPKVLVIQPQAAAHGVTLTAADTVIWFGPTSSVETYLQGNARAHRAGQKNKVTVVHLCGSEVERKVYKSLQEKGDDQRTLMSLYEEVTKEI